MGNKKNLPLYIALAIPVLMILIIAGMIYLPGIGKRAAHNFLYVSGSNVYYNYGYDQGRYEVVNNHLTYEPPANLVSVPVASEVHFFVYDVTKNEARELSFTEAQSYKLDSSNTSSDGYTVERGNGGGGFPFGGPGDYNSWFMKGHNRSVKLNLKLNGLDSYNNFRFLGWVE